MTKRFCPECGAQLLEEARFCSKCRHEIKQDSQPQTAQVEMSGYCDKCGAQRRTRRGRSILCGSAEDRQTYADVSLRGGRNCRCEGGCRAGKEGTQMKRIMRSSLRIAVIFLVTVMLFTAALPVIPVSADSESTGYWELTGTEVEGDGQQWFDGWNKSEYKYTVSAQPGRYIYTWVCNEDYYSASGILLNNKGDTSTVVCTNSQPPTTIQGVRQFRSM